MNDRVMNGIESVEQVREEIVPKEVRRLLESGELRKKLKKVFGDEEELGTLVQKVTENPLEIIHTDYESVTARNPVFVAVNKFLDEEWERRNAEEENLIEL